MVDPFSGSGSTGIGAVGVGRRYIGCENNPGYYTESLARFTEQYTIMENEGFFLVE